MRHDYVPWDVKSQAAQHKCPACDDRHDLGEEILLIQVVRSRKESGTLQFWAPEEGDRFAFQPKFLHIWCWDEAELDLRKEIRSQDRVEDSRSALDCAVCGSGVFEGEVMGLVSPGSFEVADQCPDGRGTVTFEHAGTPVPVCTSCMRSINEYVLNLWEENPTEVGECEEGSAKKCWRYQSCPFHCPNKSEGVE